MHATQTCAQSGLTAVMYAAAHGHLDCARLLLDAGADKNAKDNVRIGSLRDVFCARMFGKFVCVDAGQNFVVCGACV